MSMFNYACGIVDYDEMYIYGGMRWPQEGMETVIGIPPIRKNESKSSHYRKPYTIRY